MTRCRIICLAILTMLQACADSPTTPMGSPDIVVETPTQWSGGSVRLRSAGFESSGVVTVAIGDTVVEPNAVSPDVVEFPLPALLSGQYEATVRLDGSPIATLSINVVGLAREPTFVSSGGFFTVLFDLYPTPRGRILIAEKRCLPISCEAGYGIANLIAQEVAVAPTVFQVQGEDLVKMMVPGPSFRPNHYVFDLSPDGAFEAKVWRVWPEIAPMTTLACGFDSRSTQTYTVAEVSETDCLEMRGPSIWRNGTELLVAEDLDLELAQFRMAPGGTWTVPVTRPFGRRDGLEVWPVFGQDARLAYTVDRYSAVPGATFTSAGDALYVAARDRFDEKFWRVDHLDPATGEVRKSLSFPDAQVLLDVLVDEARSRLYTASSLDGGSPVLHVIDLESFELLASVKVPVFGSCMGAGSLGVLTPGGSADQVHLATLAGTCPILNWTFDLK